MATATFINSTTETITITNTTNSTVITLLPMLVVTGSTVSTTLPYPAIDLVWIASDSTGIQYNANPPLTTFQDDVSFTITAPCTVTVGAEACVEIINNTGKVATLTNIPASGLTALPTIYVSSSSVRQTVAMPIQSTWTMSGISVPVTIYAQNYSENPIVLENLEAHTYETTFRPYSTIENIAYVAIAFGAAAFIIGIIIITRPTTGGGKLEGDETISESDLNSPSPPSHIILIILAFLLFVVGVLLSVVYFMFRNTGNATYAQCAAKQGFGTLWRWAMPTSSKNSAFVCKVFGLCECVSDIGENNCTDFAQVHSGYSWSRENAAKSTNNNICFCCNGGTCVDENGSAAKCIAAV